MRSAELLGPGHDQLGAIAAVAEGPAAITLSRGGAPKTYAYTDPNEDACCFATGASGLFAAVADGHFGARGAACTIRWLLATRAAAWTAGSGVASDRAGWCTAARQLLADAHAEIVARAETTHTAPAPTTLSVVLVRPDQGLIVHASIGDSHVFLVPEDPTARVRDVGWASTGRSRTFFLGEPFGRGTPEDDQVIVGCEPVEGVAAVVLASDGLSENGIGVPDPGSTVADCTGRARAVDRALRPLEACRNVTLAALDAHRANRSGDNIATAVLWFSEAAH